MELPASLFVVASLPTVGLLLLPAVWGNLGSGGRAWGRGHPNSGWLLVLFVLPQFLPSLLGCVSISEMFSEALPSPESLWF